MPILTENSDRPACLPGSKDEPFLPSINQDGGSPPGHTAHDPGRENKQNGYHSNSHSVGGNKSSRKTTTGNNINTSNSNNNSHRSVFNGDNDNVDKYLSGNKQTNNHNTNNNNYNNNGNVFNDRNHFTNDSLSSRLGQYHSHYDSGAPGVGHKSFFSAPASESSTPFKLPSIDRSKSNSVSSLVSDRHLAHRHRQNSIRGPSRDRRSRLCRSPSCPSNLGCYWNDDDEDDFYDNDGDVDPNHQNGDSRNYNYHLRDDEMSSMITPDTARLPPGQKAGLFLESSGPLQLQKSDSKIPVSSQSSSRPCFGPREDSCTATNSSIKLPSIFPSRGSHNSSFLTTASSGTGFFPGGGPEEVLTADSSAVTSRDSSPFAFKREPTFFTLGQGRRDTNGCHGNSGPSPGQHTLHPPDVASRAAMKLSLASSALSPRQEMDGEHESQDTFNSTMNTTRSSHSSSLQQHCTHGNQQQQQQQQQQSSALLLPISSTSDAKHSNGTNSARTQEAGGKRKRKKNGSKPSTHGLGEPTSDAVTEKLLREKLGAIERRNNESFSPTTLESVNTLDDGLSMAEMDDLNLIERVKHETNERNSVNVGARDRDSKMSVGAGVTGGDGGNQKQSVYQNTPTRIKTEKKVASVKA